GTARPGWARLTPTGALDHSFIPSVAADSPILPLVWDQSGQVVLQIERLTHDGDVTAQLFYVLADATGRELGHYRLPEVWSFPYQTPMAVANDGTLWAWTTIAEDGEA